jgi:hypothetical protein
MHRRWWISIFVLLAAGTLCALLVRKAGSTSTPTGDNTKRETLPASSVGTQLWIAWLRSLPQEEQSKVLAKIEASMYPVETSSEDWKAVRVAPGPGSAQGDVFPCKVLTNYKRLLRPREGLGILGLQFLIDRDKNSILTSIWGANAKGAILVDWTNEKVVPTPGAGDFEGTRLCPQCVTYGLVLMGGHGELSFCGATFPLGKGLRAYPLVLNNDEPMWFGTIYQEKPPELRSLVCVSPKPATVLGEIKMPLSKTAVACLYDPKQEVLLIAEYEWTWIAMVDISRQPAPRRGGQDGSGGLE